MKKESIYQEISDAVLALLKLARESSYNDISDNCRFIISEIRLSDKNFVEQNKIRKKENGKKLPQLLDEIIVELENLYPNLYDVNLYIYKASKYSTIIEIQYFPRSSLGIDQQEKTPTREPMLHCKVAIPPYASDGKERFDINWQLGTLSHQWKMIWWQRKTKKYRESLRPK